MILFCSEIYISGVALSKMLCTRQPHARIYIHCDDVRLSHAMLGQDVRWKYDLNLSINDMCSGKNLFWKFYNEIWKLNVIV